MQVSKDIKANSKSVMDGWGVLCPDTKRIKSQLWMGEAFYVQTRLHHKVLNDDSRETSSSMQGNAVNFAKICRKTEKAAWIAVGMHRKCWPDPGIFWQGRIHNN
jgi:hypothetical protein